MKGEGGLFSDILLGASAPQSTETVLVKHESRKLHMTFINAFRQLIVLGFRRSERRCLFPERFHGIAGDVANLAWTVGRMHNACCILHVEHCAQ